MQHLRLMLAVAVLSVVAGVPGSSLVGIWSNVEVSKGEDPHASGIEVEIWRDKGLMFGFFSEYVGPVADPPVGKLDSIHFDEKTGAISFTSRLSVGVVPAAQGNAWVPSRNLYEFKGVVGKDGMVGTLRRKSVQVEGTELAYDENVTLKTKAAAGDLPPNESFDDWTKRWNEALKKRGPKW